MPKINKIYWFIAASAVIAVLDFFGFLNPIKGPLDFVVIPVKKEIYNTVHSVRNFTQILADFPQISKIYEERMILAKEKQDLEFRLNQLSKENSKLRIQLEAPFSSAAKFVPANVIQTGDFMELDAGSEQGVKAGQPVVDGQMLVGKVESVSSRRSKVILLSDPDFKMDAVTNRGTRGEINGQAGQTVLFSRVLQKDPLFLDDQAITAGDDQTPVNLLIGKISYISKDEAATYKQARITPAVKFEDEKFVFVITSL